MAGGQVWQVRGNPTEAELAAAIAVLSALAGTQSPGPPPPSRESAGWSAYWRGLRRVVPSGAGAWQASGLPYA